MNKILSDLIKNHQSFIGKKKTSIFVDKLSVNELIIYDLVENNFGFNKISQLIYNTSPSGSTYQKCRNSLVSKLIKSYLLISKGNSVQKKKSELWRHIALCKILGQFGLKSIWVKLSKKIILKCKNLELNYELADLYRMLFKYYATQEKDIALATKYRILNKDAIKSYDDECNAEWIYCRSIHYLSTMSSEIALKNIIEAMDKLDRPNKTTHRYEYYVRFTDYIIHYLKGDKKETIKYLINTRSYFRNKNLNHNQIDNILSLEIIKNYLESNALKSAKDELLTLINSRNVITVQYYRCKELLLKIYLYEVNQQEAVSIFSQLKLLNNKLNEKDAFRRLMIYEMYIDLLKGEPIKFRKIKYNLNKVRNEKDEIMVPYMIGEICYNFIYNQDKLLDSLEAISIRVYRNLNDPKYSRTKSFLKIIASIIKHNTYDLQILENEVPISNNSVEIIKYELLLNFLLNKREGL